MTRCEDIGRFLIGFLGMRADKGNLSEVILATDAPNTSPAWRIAADYITVRKALTSRGSTAGTVQ